MCDEPCATIFSLENKRGMTISINVIISGEIGVKRSCGSCVKSKKHFSIHCGFEKSKKHFSIRRGFLCTLVRGNTFLCIQQTPHKIRHNRSCVEEKKGTMIIIIHLLLYTYTIHTLPHGLILEYNFKAVCDELCATIFSLENKRGNGVI